MTLERDARSKPLNLSTINLWPMEAGPQDAFLGDEERLAVLASYGLEHLEGDEELSQLARFAAHLCETSAATINLIQSPNALHLASFGGADSAPAPAAENLCAFAMKQAGFVEFCDTYDHSEVANLAVVTGPPHVRYYAAWPLISGEGAPLGALCVTDPVPRPDGLTPLQREGLKVLAASVRRRLETQRETTRTDSELKESANRLQFMLDSVPDIAWSAAPGFVFDYFNARFTEVTGLGPRKDVDDWREVIHPDDFDASLAKLEKAMASATLFEDEWRLRLADGSYRWVISRAVPSTDDPATARWFGTLTDIHERYSASQEREMVAGELAHRIKNIFSVISGLVTMHAGKDKRLRDFARSLNDNIRALSRAQDFALRAGAHSGGKLIELLDTLMAPYGMTGSDAFSIAGDDSIVIGARAATPLALVFHELATNCAKYGAFSVPDGSVAIHVQQSEENILIAWRESDGPVAREPEDTGFGSRLVKMAIEHQLGGAITQNWRAQGLEVDITVPLDRLEG